MSSRDVILSRIKTSLSGLSTKAGETKRREAVSARLANHAKGVVPASQDMGTGLVAHFAKKALEASASVEIVKRSAIARTLSRFLRDHNLPQILRHGADARLQKIEWPQHGGPQLLSGPSDGTDIAGLSHAFAGVSETGTLVLLSGPDNPTTLNFLPENHICLVEANDIEASYEAVWTRLRRKHRNGVLPRTINMVTGPSRSADIEQTLILGAHGPVRLHILIVQD